jgi:hypothetical protein
MLKHAKLIGAVALGGAAAVTFVVIGTAGKPPAPPALTSFTGAVVSPSDVDVRCKAGETAGNANVQVKATTPAPPGATLGSGQRIVVTWTGGSGSAAIDKLDKFFKTAPGSTFPCPPGAGTLTQFSFQLFNGTSPAGTPVSASATFHRVGSPS